MIIRAQMPTAHAVAPGRRLDDSALSLGDDSWRARYNVSYGWMHLEFKGLCPIKLKFIFYSLAFWSLRLVP